jgi:hypothetical protein
MHACRKDTGNLRAGQALRGSSELHAWGDSNLYLRRRGDVLRLSIEHRAARSPADLSLALPAVDRPLALEIIEETEPDTTAARTPEQRVYETLAAASRPLALAAIRDACRIRTSTLCAILNGLSAEGTIQRTPRGYTVVR